MPEGLRKNAEALPVEVRPGIIRRTLNEGQRTMLVEFRMTQGGLIAAHSHPQEQIGYLVSGRLRCRIGKTSMELTAGDSWCVPPNVEHEAAVLEDAIAIDIFSPPREDYGDPGLAR
jgi:quercetin dioxygenase-like cupin family protein